MIMGYRGGYLPKERRKMERGINRRFKKAVKAQNLQETE